MFRKNYYLGILAIALLLTGSFAAFGQTRDLSGEVELKNADGTTSPLEGATVEVYRVDSKNSFPAVKTDASGKFTIPGLAADGEYVLQISGEKLKPEISQILTVDMKGIKFVISPGDGKKFSEAQIREAIAKAGELTPEQKAERDRIAAKNKKAEETNTTISSSLAEGAKAFEAKNYDLAIVKFEEGYQASPDYVGSAPLMLNNKGAALVKRALIAYNKMVQSKDAAEKNELRPKVAEDFEAAIDAYSTSWKVSKSGNPDEIAKIQKNFETTKSQTLLGAQEAVSLMVRTETAHEAKKDAVAELINEYVAFEKDQKKKEAAQLSLGSYMNKVYDFEAAIKAFRKAIEIEPGNPDAIGSLGLALYTVTYDSDDTARKQEGLNYMQHYLDTAPKDHPLRDGLDGAVKDLMSKKMKPQKIAGKN